MVEFVVFDEHRQGYGGEVANGNFVRRGVLDDLGTKVGRADGAQVLLVALSVGRILIEHIRGAGFDLGFQDLLP